MAIFRHLIGRAVRHVASDPRAQEKAKTFLREEVAPRARQAARQGRDAYDVVRDDWRESGDHGQAGSGQEESAGDSTARRAGRFLGKLHNRLNQDPGR